VSDCCLTPNEQFFSYIMARTSYFQWNDDVRFVLDQHAELDFYMVLAHWNNSPRVDMLFHSSLLLLLCDHAIPLHHRWGIWLIEHYKVPWYKITADNLEIKIKLFLHYNICLTWILQIFRIYYLHQSSKPVRGWSFLWGHHLMIIC